MQPCYPLSEILGVAMCAGVGSAILACVGYSLSPADSLCLNRFTLQSVVSDENLWTEIDDRRDIVTCSFWVCGDKLQIRRISVHKKNCPRVWMWWYANWGCG
jgi:hypothetical protein